jgi:hypothetical protein
MTRLLLVLGCLLVACGCASPGPTLSQPSASSWGSSVPTAAPAAIISQPIVAQSDSTITLLPVSPRGATILVPYAYTTPHCGILGAIDVDGSFWDVVKVSPNGEDFGGLVGTFELETTSTATFRWVAGALELVRHPGAKQFQLCE